MACRTDTRNIDKISRRIRVEIAKDYLERKKQWDLPSDARLIINDLIKLVKQLEQIVETR